MKTESQISKIKAVVLYILDKIQGEVDYIHLFKIMYFAQQIHLVAYGLPIFDETFCARKLGPVPSLTYKVLRDVENGNEGSVDLSSFMSSIAVSRENGFAVVRALEAYDGDELSVSEITALNESISKYKDVDSSDLSDLSHDSAWKKAKAVAERTQESAKIPLYEIAKAGGASKEMLDLIRERQWVANHLS